MKSRPLANSEILELRKIIRDNGRTAAEIKRAQAILLKHEDEPLKKIRSLTGYVRSHISRLYLRFLDEGVDSIADKRVGKPKEILSKKQRDEIVKTVSTKTPKDLKYAHDHWTTGILGNWIEKKYKVAYKSKTSLYLVFKQAKFTYHKPGRTYDKHNDKEIEKWKKAAKPTLKKLFEEKDTVILSGDEMILTTETTIQKVWLPQGEYPKIVCLTGGRKRRNVYGFLNMRTGVEHAWKTGLQNMYVTREILEKVRALYPKQKIALFWDNAGWHKGSVAQEFIKTDGNIAVINFPAYAPEENPQEHVWKSGREQVTHNRFIEDIDAATDELVNYFNATKFQYQLLGMSLIS